MRSKGLTQALQDAVHEHGQYRDNGLYVDARDLPLADKKLLLSYLLDLSDYIDAVHSPTYLEAIYCEKLGTIQGLLDEQSAQAYHDCMYEMGMVKHIHPHNGEAYWAKR